MSDTEPTEDEGADEEGDERTGEENEGAESEEMGESRGEYPEEGEEHEGEGEGESERDEEGEDEGEDEEEGEENQEEVTEGEEVERGEYEDESALEDEEIDEDEEEEEGEEEIEGEGKKERKIRMLPLKLQDEGSEEEVEEESEEDIYTEKTVEPGEGGLELKRTTIEIEEDELAEYEDEEDEYGYISGPYIPDGSTVPADVLAFYHSFGYDCRRHYNICIPDPNTVIFASGNYINFFDIITKELTFQRTARGGGIGHITKNPKYPHIAVAEKGLNPLIIIYLWPSMERFRVLRGGAKRAFASLHYSPDGKYLCSQGCEPDYFLTVWNWRRGKILRQQKAYGQDVFNAMFSNYSEGNITTAGYGHIKFWKLARTFTGLKLMGSIGRFGKTEMCDIIGFIALPDEQVISGCEWGNMLIWDEGLVKAEICRKADLPCHEGYISQLLYDSVDEELITVGTDGFVKFWDYKLIEQTDLVGECPKIKIETLISLEVGKEPDKSQLLYIEKQDPQSENHTWFAQDGNGGIWLIDLDQDHPEPPEKLFKCHAGAVRSIAACPYDDYVASYGDDGRIIFYNYRTKRTMLVHKFCAGGGFMLWPDLSIEPSGDVVICGGADGLIRIAVVALQKREAAGETAQDDDFISLIQTTKPHTMRITYMAIRESNKILVTGSEDATIFIYQILYRSDYVSLNPIGFVRMPSEVTHITWKDEAEAPIAIVSVSEGQVAQVEVPDVPQIDTKVSYELHNVEVKLITFHSVKSQIRRDIIIEEDIVRRQEKLEMKKQKLKQMREDNPNLKLDDEIFLEDSESSISLESLYFPAEPCRILFSMFIAPDVLWLSPTGFDAGYLYEYMVGYEDPTRCTMIADADDVEVHSYIFDPTGQFLILGMQDGRIRVCRIKEEEFADLSDYWVMSAHDNDNGIIPQMCFSHDNRFFFSCGHDGNVFAFTVASEKNKIPVRKEKKSSPWPSDALEDIDDPNMYSLEQLKQKAEYDRKMKLANDHKEEVLASLQKLKEKFEQLIKSNETLPVKLQIPYGDFKIDPRIEDDLEDELDDKMRLEKRKVAFQAEKSDLGLRKLQDYYYNILDSDLMNVYTIKCVPRLRAYTFRVRSLSHDFFAALRFVLKRLDLADQAHKPVKKRASRMRPSKAIRKPLQLASWLKGIGNIGANVKMNTKLQRLLLKYYERKRNAELREEQWNEMRKMKPDPNVSHPDDLAAIEHAEKTIGDYKMKTDPNYTLLQTERMTTDKKYKQLLETRQQIVKIKKEFNRKIYKLRDRKVALIQRISDLHIQLKKKHKELPFYEIIKPYPIPKMDMKFEFPEKEYRLAEEDILKFYPTASTSASDVREEVPQQGEENEVEGEEEEEEETEGEEEEGDLSQDKIEDIPKVSIKSIELVKIDSDYEIFLRDETAPPPMKTRRSISGLRKGKPPSKFEGVQFYSDIDVKRFIFKSRHDDRDTPWEKEMRYRRLCRTRYEQDKIIKEINDGMEEFDKEVERLKDTRYQIAVDIKFGELHLIKLHQELIILKKFESVEDRLALQVANIEEEVHSVMNEISDMDQAVENHEKEIEHLLEEAKNLGVVFLERIEENHYADFLKKIYKKKYKPPKVKRADDDESSESSSESSESSEEEDEGSVDSEDMGVIKLDESICPPDLDREIYDMTFEMRTQRHGLEIKEGEEKKEIENLKRDKEQKFKSIRVLEKNLQEQKLELLEYQREKQHQLNEVMVVIALKANQLQYFDDPDADLIHMQDKLAFSYQNLGKLVQRVDELHNDSLLQQRKLSRYKQHHFRMQIDCKHMRKVIKELNQEIRVALLKKFGCAINVEEMEDLILQRLIIEMRSTLQDIKKEFERVAAILKNEMRRKQKVLTELYKSNAEKMNVLTLLVDEKSNLIKLLAPKEPQEETSFKDLFEYSEELKKLRRVMKNQEVQTNLLKEEIKNLGFKGKPLIPICTPEKLQAELKKLELLAEEAKKLPEVEDEEEDDENMFLYMESSEAVQLVSERTSLDDGSVLPTARQIIDDLIKRIDVAHELVPAERVLDDEIEKLINRIPSSDAATGIFEEVTELLAARLATVRDQPDLKEALESVLHDMRGIPASPSQVKLLFQYVFKRVKDREGILEAALDARAITYDILRKCIGFILGQKFFLCTEEAMLQILETLNEDTETRVLIEEVLFDLNAKIEELRDKPDVCDVLEDIVHDLSSLQSHEVAKEIFRKMFQGLRARAGPEREMAVARQVFHDVLKKAIGIVAETSFPLGDRGNLDPQKVVALLLEHLPKDQDMDELFDEIEILLEMREATVDPPNTQHLLQTYAHDVLNRGPMKTEQMKPFFDQILQQFSAFGASDKELFQANAVLCDTLLQAIPLIFPDVKEDTKEIEHLLEPGSVTLTMLDKIPSSKDTTKMYDDIIEELTDKHKGELLSEGVQSTLLEVLDVLENVQNKDVGIKNTFADIIENIKEKRLFKSDIACVLKLMEDATRNALQFHFPELMLQNDEDVKNAEQYIARFIQYLEPQDAAPFFHELADILDSWETKTSDTPEVGAVLKEIVHKLRTLPEEQIRLKKAISYVFKLIHTKGQSKEMVLRLLYILKYCVKAAIRNVKPSVDLEDEECHFNPDDTTLEMLKKLPETPFVSQLCCKIKEEIETTIKQVKITKGMNKVLQRIINKLSSIQSSTPNLFEEFENVFEQIKEMDVPKLDNIYARIYVNDVVRKAISIDFPRVDIREAKCCMDKERSTLLMFQKIPVADEVLGLFQEVREEMESRYETIESDQEVQKVIHDVVLQLYGEPTESESAFSTITQMYTKLSQQQISRLSLLTAKNIFYEAVKKCIDIVFPSVDLDDALIIDKEWPIFQMLSQVPFGSYDTQVIEAIIKELQQQEESSDGIEKDMFTSMIEDLSGEPLETGSLSLFWPCFQKIKEWGAPAKCFKTFKEKLYIAVKNAIQTVCPEVDLQDNQTAWENEEDILTQALTLPQTEDTTIVIDEIREHLEIVKASTEISEGLQVILNEIEHHLTALPIEAGDFEHHITCIFTILAYRRGDQNDLAKARSMIYKAARDSIEVIREEAVLKTTDA